MRGHILQTRVSAGAKSERQLFSTYTVCPVFARTNVRDTKQIAFVSFSVQDLSGSCILQRNSARTIYVSILHNYSPKTKWCNYVCFENRMRINSCLYFLLIRTTFESVIAYDDTIFILRKLHAVVASLVLYFVNSSRELLLYRTHFVRLRYTYGPTN